MPAVRAEAAGHPPARLTVRARVLAVVVTLAALGMLAAGGTAFLIQRERVDVLLDAALARNVDEFRTLAEQGLDPRTGEPFADSYGVLYTALQRTVPSPNEGMFAVHDGRISLVAASAVRLRLDEVPDVVTAAEQADGDAEVRLRTVSTAATSYRIVTIPVAVTGDPATGVLVYGFDREAEHAELVRTYRTFALVGFVALVVVAVVGWVLAGRLLAPLRDLRLTAQQITDSDLSRRIEVTGEDDVSDLARTVNSMLDRLEQAFASQRRLLDDAGHELRTPLTIIRGHLELVDADDPADVRATQELVLDELDRMGRLVDDLVVLATVDRPDFVRTAPVDVGRLTDEVLDKARALGERDWRVEARAETAAIVDGQRLTQAWLQLVANAVKFTGPGSQIRLGSAVVGERLQVWVHDDGPGIPAELAERVFERFVRGEAGRGVEGSGLGLPIVAAIAEAHGGSAGVDRTAPGGARIVIDLPVEPAPSKEDQ